MDVGTAQTLFSSYRSGLLRKAEESVRLPGQSFDDLLRNALINRLSLASRQRFRSCFAFALAGLRNTRAGDLDVAEEKFYHARNLYVQALEGDPAQHFMLIFLETAEAYLDSRKGNFDKARERVVASMAADLFLEEVYSCGFLQMHRVQAVHNLARLHWKQGHVSDGCALVGSIVAFLEGRSDSLPVHRGWSTGRLYHSPAPLRRAMLLQVIEEATQFLVGTCSDAAWRALLSGAKLFHASRYPRPLYPRIDIWLRAEAARNAGDELVYYRLLESFLAEGRQEIGIIWYMAVTSFAELCGRSSSGVAHFVRDAILRDSPKWPHAPKNVMTFLEREQAL